MLPEVHRGRSEPIVGELFRRKIFMFEGIHNVVVTSQQTSHTLW